MRGFHITWAERSSGSEGATLRLKADAGRDHYPEAYTAVLAGGAIQGGLR